MDTFFQILPGITMVLAIALIVALLSQLRTFAFVTIRVDEGKGSSAYIKGDIARLSITLSEGQTLTIKVHFGSIIVKGDKVYAIDKMADNALADWGLTIDGEGSVTMRAISNTTVYITKM